MEVIKGSDRKEILKRLLSRSKLEIDEINSTVKDILSNTRMKKDKALREYTEKFDGVLLEDFLVSEEEMENALKNINRELKEDLIKAAENIKNYHEKQLRKSYFLKEDKNIVLGQIISPLEKVGIYVPGGSASYPSTVLMNALPAKIAGVNEITMISPPNKYGKIKDSILVAAFIAGVNKIYKIGGAQGIAALAFGTETVGKVDKITGPGNIYVTLAKKQVSGYVGIDMLAGPSEIMIIADQWANPKYIAADLISQAEHDKMSASILVTDYEPIIDKVLLELELQIPSLERKDIIKKSLEDYGIIILTESLEESIEVVNEIAPEHLEILTENPFEIYSNIKNAGAIFLGEYSPEPVGDYFAGTNHTLPTSSTSRFSSSLSVDDFIKKTSLIYYSKEALLESKDSIIRIAEEEGLRGHANSVKIRFEDV
ncbi:histidinol dehydrogenase [Tissierella praeacuta]|uniref:histidinol dehydrogenase n=1 Tax=Tissierella praeacuta TaxID=43131 RepID=UPI001C11DF82|nr:histidinol dehydrogenase [Tissierella praeacuta]MBU5257328.1 histidinol dehydrogenase [Tissierella praeacuta]